MAQKVCCFCADSPDRRSIDFGDTPTKYPRKRRPIRVLRVSRRARSRSKKRRPNRKRFLCVCVRVRETPTTARPPSSTRNTTHQSHQSTSSTHNTSQQHQKHQQHPAPPSSQTHQQHQSTSSTQQPKHQQPLLMSPTRRCAWCVHHLEATLASFALPVPKRYLGLVVYSTR